MRLAELHDGQVVRARLGRYRDGMDHPDWQPWADVTLHIQRAPANVPKRMVASMICPPGGIAVLAVKGRNWAEYGERDFSPAHRVFECEGYYLEIEGLTP